MVYSLPPANERLLLLRRRTPLRSLALHPVLSFMSLVLLLGLASAPSWSGQSTSNPRQGSIEWYAQRAKQQGDTSITIESPRGIHEQISSLDEALSTYHVVIGSPTASLTQLVDSTHVYTWYKLHIGDTLISHPNPEVPPVTIPDALLPVGSDEIVIRVPGGTVTLDGVRVTVTDRAVRLLSIDSNYLLFLSPDSSGKFAYIRAGSNAIFTMTPDKRVVPLVATQSRMQTDLDSSTGGSVDAIRDFAKAKAYQRSSNK